MAETLVKVQNVSKKFCKDLKLSMLYGVHEIAQTMIGISPSTMKLRPKEFWAVDDVSFELKRGECMGLIGPNGSGKSTLLKILNGIILPDKGRVEIGGRVGALIEVGAGFHPMLTGRENIYINGAILGFSKRQIDRRFDAIVDFADMEDFIDTPVKQYSSGMYVRLGFAIAAQMDPDVLLIDEVLAVGDIGFRAKCFNTINKIINNAQVIFVSHNLPEVSRICSSISVLKKGKKIFQGKEVGAGIDSYLSFFTPKKTIISGSKNAKIHLITIASGNKKDIETINYLDNLALHFDVTIDESVKFPVLYVNIASQSLQTVAQCSSSYNKFKLRNNGKRSIVTANLGSMNLNPGIYNLSVGILEDGHGEVLARHMNFKTFKVTGDFLGYAPMQINGKWSVNQIT
jgi:lipopolysaccharide transport system ATP-binding protein